MKRIFPSHTAPEGVARAVLRMVDALPACKAYSVEVVVWKKPRTQQQNAFLWGVVYPAILEQGGETLAGWTRDDLHEYFLGECFGWDTLEGFGRKRLRPVKRSSTLNKQDFSDYLMFIETRCANMGIVIPEASYDA